MEMNELYLHFIKLDSRIIQEIPYISNIFLCIGEMPKLVRHDKEVMSS